MGKDVMQRVLKYLFHGAYREGPRLSPEKVESCTFDSYCQKMAEQRPFKLFFKHDKVQEKSYLKTSAKFKQEV